MNVGPVFYRRGESESNRDLPHGTFSSLHSTLQLLESGPDAP